MVKRLLVAGTAAIFLVGCGGPQGMMKVGPVEMRDGSTQEGYFFVSPGHVGPKLKVLGMSQCINEEPPPPYLSAPPPLAAPPAPPKKKKDPCYDRGMVAVYDRGLWDHVVAGVSNTLLPAAGFATGMAVLRPPRSETNISQQGGSVVSGDVDIRASGGQGGTGTESRITNNNSNQSFNANSSSARADPRVNSSAQANPRINLEQSQRQNQNKRQHLDPGRGRYPSHSPTGIPYPPPPVHTPKPTHGSKG